VSSHLRDNSWLESRLRNLWQSYYSDAPIGFPIEIKFGRSARYRYGSICNVGSQCRILINRLFSHEEVPEYVVDATIVHELAHYVHGYGSGLAKLHSHPHRGGVIDKELRERGCFFIEMEAAAWRRDMWPEFYLSHAGGTARKVQEREKLAESAWDSHLGRSGFRTEEDLHARLLRLAAEFGIRKPYFSVEWLPASLRRTGLSYRFKREKVVRIHGLLADRRVPAEVIDYELSYWLACEKAGAKWQAVERAIKEAGKWESAERAIKWRRHSWPRFRARNHPLCKAK
jgi:hypothetical protein